MQIDGTTKVCGLLGNPVEHTLSPLIHNTLSERMGAGLVYVPFCVEGKLLGEALKGAFALNLLGLNVTVPHKSAVIPFLESIDPLAEQIGAVNTLVRTSTGFKGYNTDLPGLYRAMCRDGVRIEGEQVILLGAGGVARAAAVLLAQKGAERIEILNRSTEKAAAIASEVNGFAGKRVAAAHALSDYPSLLGEYERTGRKFLAVQATRLGMYPDIGQSVIEDPAFYRMIHTGYDLVFNPARTRFMTLVEEAGGRACGGLGMLLYQGVIAFELWTGLETEDALADEIYQKMREALNAG